MRRKKKKKNKKKEGKKETYFEGLCLDMQLLIL